jgi:hypothetical protein
MIIAFRFFMPPIFELRLDGQHGIWPLLTACVISSALYSGRIGSSSSLHHHLDLCSYPQDHARKSISTDANCFLMVAYREEAINDVAALRW